MTENNFARLQQWKKLYYRFDYKLFCTYCEEAKLPQMNIVEFGQKVGMLTMAEQVYPDLSIEEAYMKFVSEMQPEIPYTFVHAPANLPPELPRKSCCGGGQVR